MAYYCPECGSELADTVYPELKHHSPVYECRRYNVADCCLPIEETITHQEKRLWDTVKTLEKRVATLEARLQNSVLLEDHTHERFIPTLAPGEFEPDPEDSD